MKLYVWPEYDAANYGRPGLAFAIAATEEQAREAVCEAAKRDGYCGASNDWGPVQVYEIDQPIGFQVLGSE